MSHTPGPWNITFGGGEQDDYFVIGSADRSVADFSVANYREPLSHEEMVANAKLIAAAPDLLAALDEFVTYLLASALATGLNEDEVAMLAKAEAAIKKAKGERA